MRRSSARELALRALKRWVRGRQFADRILQDELSSGVLQPADRAFTQELFYGVLRHLTLLDFLLHQLRRSKVDDDSRYLLYLGIYQLLFLHTPSHAAVFETVQLGSGKARPLINAVLRRAAQHKEELLRAATAAPLHVRESHPEFLVKRWSSAFGQEQTAALCRWNNQPPPIYARINTLRVNRETFLELYRDLESLEYHPLFVRCASMPLQAIKRGDCYIQDPSTAPAAELIQPCAGELILDACSAPGGKTAYLAALASNRARIIATDRDKARLDLLRVNLGTLGVTNVELFQHDWATAPVPSALSSLRFDKILVDAPCSNTGVIRRRVDVRWRLAAKDFHRMHGKQLAITRAVIPLLKPGGILVYSTCSIEQEENEQVIEDLLAGEPRLRIESVRALLPPLDGFDGAFATRLVCADHSALQGPHMMES